MFKVKHERTADCVVAGYRTHKSGDGRDRLAAARPLQRRRAHERRGHRGLPDGPHARELFEELQPLVTDFDDHPWAWARQEEGTRTPPQCRAEPVDRRQGPVLHPAAARAGRRGPLRPHGGRPLPPHRPVRALAPGPRPAILHLRAARRAGQLRPRRRPGQRPVEAGLLMAERWDTGRREARAPGRDRRGHHGRFGAPPLGALSSVSAAAYFARRVLTPDRQRPDDTEILAVSDAQRDPRPDRRDRRPGPLRPLARRGSRPLHGWATSSSVDEEAGRVRRELLGVDYGHARPGLRPLEPVLLRLWPGPVARPAHPRTSRCSPSSGPCPPGSSRPSTRTTRWAILVHGRGARREEGLRAVKPLRDSGINVLDPLLPQRRRRAAAAPTAATTWGCRSGATSRTRPCMPCSREPAS